jgi:hypothetical protein
MLGQSMHTHSQTGIPYGHSEHKKIVQSSVCLVCHHCGLMVCDTFAPCFVLSQVHILILSLCVQAFNDVLAVFSHVCMYVYMYIYIHAFICANTCIHHLFALQGCVARLRLRLHMSSRVQRVELPDMLVEL